MKGPPLMESPVWTELIGLLFELFQFGPNFGGRSCLLEKWPLSLKKAWTGMKKVPGWMKNDPDWIKKPGLDEKGPTWLPQRKQKLYTDALYSNTIKRKESQKLMSAFLETFFLKITKSPLFSCKIVPKAIEKHHLCGNHPCCTTLLNSDWSTPCASCKHMTHISFLENSSPYGVEWSSGQVMCVWVGVHFPILGVL